jgi:hypothetical protein
MDELKIWWTDVTLLDEAKWKNILEWMGWQLMDEYGFCTQELHSLYSDLMCNKGLIVSELQLKYECQYVNCCKPLCPTWSLKLEAQYNLCHTTILNVNSRYTHCQLPSALGSLSIDSVGCDHGYTQEPVIAALYWQDIDIRPCFLLQGQLLSIGELQVSWEYVN